MLQMSRKIYTEIVEYCEEILDAIDHKLLQEEIDDLYYDIRYAKMCSTLFDDALTDESYIYDILRTYENMVALERFYLKGLK